MSTISCVVFTVLHPSDGTPGVKSTMNVTASLAGKTADLADATEDFMFTTLSNAIVTSANKDANWQLTSSDIKRKHNSMSRALILNLKYDSKLEK